MEDSANHFKQVPDNTKTSHMPPLGMSSFGPKEREQFGQSVRIAMALMEGKPKPVNRKAMPTDSVAIRERLQYLNQDMTSHLADLLELLVRFDELQGWKDSGARHCTAWMSMELGISFSLGWDYLSAGRKLRALPTMTALFRAGKITWSKIREMVRVANADNEQILCHAALDASVSEVIRLCRDYRWDNDKNDDKGDEGERKRALKQWLSRSLTWRATSNGCTQIRLVLPPECAQAFINSVEHSLNQMTDSELQTPKPPNEPAGKEPPSDVEEASISQRRADAALLMAESSLQAAGRDIAVADRYQVIVSVDANELSDKEELSDNEINTNENTNENANENANTNTNTNKTAQRPTKRPTVKGAGALAHDTARRIACDCSITTNKTTHGEPTDIGRKSRLWPPAMARTIKERDQHCQFYGCTQTRNLQIHHIQHWADGGPTSINNGVCVCSSCHTRLHEGGYTIQRVDEHEQWLDEQFHQQRRADDVSLFDFERKLRENRVSFDEVRKLSPTRYRFRVIDAQGRDIRGVGKVSNNHSIRVERKTETLSPAHPTNANAHTAPKPTAEPVDAGHSTRVERKTETFSTAHPTNTKVHTALKSAAESVDAGHSTRVESGERVLWKPKAPSSGDYDDEPCGYNHSEPPNIDAEFTDDEEYPTKDPWKIAECHAIYHALGA